MLNPWGCLQNLCLFIWWSRVTNVFTSKYSLASKVLLLPMTKSTSMRKWFFSSEALNFMETGMNQNKQSSVCKLPLYCSVMMRLSLQFTINLNLCYSEKTFPILSLCHSPSSSPNTCLFPIDSSSARSVSHSRLLYICTK